MKTSRVDKSDTKNSVFENVGSILKDMVEGRMLIESLATRFSHTRMEEHIDAVFEKWRSIWSFLSHFCLASLLVFKVLVTPMERTLNTEPLSVNQQ
ncbi:hypothetical protein E2C01_079190 [Portunus trituberculatus]|uniref:Uncharacterized protein n=1 Tax=Portunus trituberculatus TaxID=210409 RepID=A0A5B7IKV4_PORTR|nr:hypothetical protein [Portunus trituberculatus]